VSAIRNNKDLYLEKKSKFCLYLRFEGKKISKIQIELETVEAIFSTKKLKERISKRIQMIHSENIFGRKGLNERFV